MTKPYVSTVLPDEEDNPSFIDGLLTKWDLKTTLSAAKGTKIADAKQTSLQSSSGLDEHLSVAEARDIADVAKAREDCDAQVPHGLFSQLRSHMSTLKSPFNPNDTPSPADVMLDETLQTGLTRHANHMYDDLYYNNLADALDGTFRTGNPRHTNSSYDDPYHNHPIDEGMEFGSVQSPNHDPSLPIPEPTDERTVQFDINNHDDSDTPSSKFNFGEKSHPYPTFNAGIDNIATNRASPSCPRPCFCYLAPCPCLSSSVSQLSSSSCPRSCFCHLASQLCACSSSTTIVPDK
jgi:hypothetical protein